MRHISDVIAEHEGPELQPIKTEYRGHLFRSRLEARWALFFDLIGVAWTYEGEGYELPGGRYLPDFEINLARRGFCFFEVKPYQPDLDELRKAHELAFASRRMVFIGQGMPGDESGIYAVFPEGAEDDGYHVVPCPKCGAIGIEFAARAARVCGDVCVPESDGCPSPDAFAEQARQARTRRWWP
jgi:hypothetical protein